MTLGLPFLFLLQSRFARQEENQVGFPGGSVVKESTCNTGDTSSIPGSGKAPEEGMATHCNSLAWRIP